MMSHNETTISHPPPKESTPQLLPRRKFNTHHVKSGVNPLVDAAAYLFSIMGKLKRVKSYRQLSQLNKELVVEIHLFEAAATALGYQSESVLVSCYAMCASFDDIITSTPWGNEGQWDEYSLLKTFNQEQHQPDRFFAILERIIKDPELYIDLMEFMYLCLSLGFKGNYCTEEGYNQYEQICHALYKRIRAFKGEVQKTLSPFPVKATALYKLEIPKKLSWPSLLLTTASTILAIFIGLSYLHTVMIQNAYQELMQIGKTRHV